MGRLRQLLSRLFICSTVFVACAFAQTNLVQILDTVYNADKSLFNGTVIITWNGFTSSSGSTIGPHSTSAQIVNGVLSVFLVPSTTASSGACYVATYNSSDGTVTWTEDWEVPPSSTPLTLNQVRQPGACGSDSGGGGTGGGGTISISQVVGLSADLNSLTGSLNSLTSTVNGISSTIATLSSQVASLTSIVNNLNSGSNAVFADAETPAGAINGNNAAFTLKNAPLPPASLNLYRNGVILTNGADYTLSGTAITFSSSAIPQAADVLQAYYRGAGTGQTSKFADAELPGGTIDGSNLTFTLLAPPNPASSLKLYKNGILLLESSDYALNGASITFAGTNVTPQPGDSLLAYYRF